MTLRYGSDSCPRFPSRAPREALAMRVCLVCLLLAGAWATTIPELKVTEKKDPAPLTGARALRGGGVSAKVQVSMNQPDPTDQETLPATSPTTAMGSEQPPRASRSPAYPKLPWDLALDKAYIFTAPSGLGGSPINLDGTTAGDSATTQPFDMTADNTLLWSGGPAFLTLTRYARSPFGAWDQLLVIPGSYRLSSAGPPHMRVTEAYSSISEPTHGDFPMGMAHKQAVFKWVRTSDDTEDLTVHLLGQTDPLFQIQGLRAYSAAPAIPLPNQNLAVMQTLSAGNWATPQHVRNRVAYTGRPAIARYGRIRSNLSSSNVQTFMPVGVYFGNSTRVQVTVTKITV